MLLPSQMLWIFFGFIGLCTTNFTYDQGSQIDNSESTNETSSSEIYDEDTGKIIGGVVITIDEVPCLVSVQYGPFGDYFAHRCGGCLVSSKYVLTAAHCMVSVTQSKQLRIRAGSSRQTTGGQVKGCRNYIIHPQYDAKTYDYDIAILELVSRVWLYKPLNIPLKRFFSWLLPRPRAPQAAELSTVIDVPDNATLYTAGWGATQVGGFAVDTLYAVELPYVSPTICKAKYSQTRISNNMICAGYKQGGRDTCQGDSGGPIFYLQKLIGIVSWGDGCAKANKPGVYSRIPELIGFIKKYVKFD